jgi:hypothetical protein
VGVFKDLLGTLNSTFQFGLGGVKAKTTSSQLAVRNAADAAYAAVRASLFATYGDDFELNAGAAGSGDDWKMSFRRPSTGMTHALIVKFPSGDPSPGQALTVDSFAGDLITLEWTTIAGGDDKIVVDTTALAFGTASPVAMFTLPANAAVLDVSVIVDTAFDGTPSMSVGIAGTTSKYMASTQVDLTATALTSFSVSPNIIPAGGTEALIITYAAGGASAGAARVLVSYVIPS